MPGIVLDCRNNVIYNWGDMSGQSTVCPVKINYAGAYLKPGPSTWPESRAFAFYPGGPLTGLFMANNHIEGCPEKDADYDGAPDAWERKQGLDPNDPADGNLDADADGYTNIEEYLNATDPQTPDTVSLFRQ